MPTPCVDIRQSRTIRLRTSPDWLPEKFRQRSSRRHITFRTFQGERRFLRRKKPESPSVWAPKNRVVTYGPLKGSRWDNSFMPHFRGIMDASFYPSVRMIGNCKVPQSGSSAGAETIVGYIADRKPGPVAICYPDQGTTSRRCDNYLQPMFTESPRLRELLTGKEDDLSQMMIKLKTMLIHMCWSGSVASLGNISAQYLIMDELEKWVKFPSKKETSSYLLFLERFRAYMFGAKAWLFSTPSDVDGFLWQYMTKEAQVVFDYWITCPSCGHHQPLDFRNVRLLEPERDPQVIQDKDLARYCCGGCGEMLTNRQRKKALESGVWHAIGNGEKFRQYVERGDDEVEVDGRELFDYLRAENPEKIGFHSPALVTKLVSLNEIMGRWFAGLLDGAAMSFYDTQIRAIAHVPFRQARKEDAIFILADDRPDRLVPGQGQVAALVAAADTQDNGWYFEIRAVGWGLTQETWQVRYGFVTTKEELLQALFQDTYQDADGLYYPVHLCVIDSQGHRTTEVYDMTRMFPGRLQAYKGGKGRKPVPKVFSTIDTYPGTNKKIPGGVSLVTVDTHHYKDDLAAKLKIKPEDPGAWHLLASVKDDDPHGRDYAAQMCAEYVDEHRLWQCPKNKPNHYWDTGMMCLVAADILQVKYWQQGEA